MVEEPVLKPVDSSTLPIYEAEDKAMDCARACRVMMASYETIKATGKSVACLSPWGDSSPLLLPCIRFWDVVASTITLGTGGTAAIVAPAISPRPDVFPGGSNAASFVTAQLISSAGKEAAVNWLLVDKPLDDLLRTHTHVLDGNSAKETLIPLKYKHVTKDTALGRVETSTSAQAGDGADHQDAELHPAEPKPAGLKVQTNRLGNKLLNKDASSEVPTGGAESAGGQPAVQTTTTLADAAVDQSDLNPLAEASTSVPSRWMIILPLGVKPHRARAWTSSASPGESASCVTSSSTAAQLLWFRTGEKEEVVDGVVRILLEYVELCVDWERMVVASKEKDELKREAIRDALTLLVERLVKAGQSQDVKEKVDADRAGIVFFGLPCSDDVVFVLAKYQPLHNRKDPIVAAQAPVPNST
ncbi:hypothetical protein FRC00_004132 [Tulasnella sp. 408]|nr:hypothetical protein FRC00_004132 [Tulasnella sp. 408]